MEREYVPPASTDSNTKWLDDLADDLLKALSNFKTRMEFQKKDFNEDKPRQSEEVRKEIAKIDELYVGYFVPVSLPLFPSDMGNDEETRSSSTLMFDPHCFLFSFFLSLL